jgi:hypothetical protein
MDVGACGDNVGAESVPNSEASQGTRDSRGDEAEDSSTASTGTIEGQGESGGGGRKDESEAEQDDVHDADTSHDTACPDRGDVTTVTEARSYGV